jgi:hypothetical protein
MTNNAGLKSCKNFYNKKFKEWQPTLLHKSMPALIFSNDYFENVKKFVKDKGEDGIADEFKHDGRFKIISDIKNEITKGVLLSILSDILGDNSSYEDIIEIIADATIDALFL